MYRIIKKESDRFTIDLNGESVICFSRKKNKKDEILIGDFVTLEGDSCCNGGDSRAIARPFDCNPSDLNKSNPNKAVAESIIECVAKRKNRLIRPAIANVDQVIFVLCSVPKPDFYLLDKAIVNCLKNNIDILICINKSDINDPEFEGDILSQYIGREILSISATSGDMVRLRQALGGKMSCLAGQSAVGKSTIINAIFGEKTTKVGDLSAIGRGKNTTTSSELYKVGDGFLADTPGFSMLDIFDLDYRELNLFYPEFEGICCRYHCCTHIDEPDCGVKAALTTGKINVKRFDRYVELFTKLKTEHLNKFK